MQKELPIIQYSCVLLVLSHNSIISGRLSILEYFKKKSYISKNVNNHKDVV